MFRLLAIVLGLAACEVTPEKITAWKGTERGPAKLRETVSASSVSPVLRAQALAALTEIGMSQEALAELSKASVAERQAVVHEAVAKLASLAMGGGADSQTTRAQREAKDALFLLRSEALPNDRDAIDDQLIAWTTTDLMGRMSVGGHGSEKILLAIGSRAAPRLIELLAQEGPSGQTAAAIVAKIADAPTRARASLALVERARHSVARTNDIADGLLQSLALLGGPRAIEFLVEQADKGRDSLREHVLYALAQAATAGGAADSRVLAVAGRIAADKRAPGKVREAAFQLAEKIGAGAVATLVKLMTDADETVRWRAVEAALAAGKDKAIAPVLEALSPARTYKKEDLDSFVVHDLALLGAPAIGALKEELRSKNPIARVASVRALALVGRAEDAQALASLAKDGSKLKGFPGSATLGSEAHAAETALRAKR